MIWFARAAWVVLPVTAGGVLQDALDPWSRAPAVVAAALAWAAWAAALLALLAPRPWGFTVLRVAAAIAIVLTITSLPSTGTPEGALAILSVVLAAVLALSGPVAAAAAQSVAYGDERRFPLRAPLGLVLGPLPVAALLVAAGVAAGPILLADGRVLTGAAALLAGGAVAAILGRSLYSLDRRWLVLVPAGIVVADPLTLTDPVLLVREKISGLARADTARRAAGVLDLRLGTTVGGLSITLREPGTFSCRRGRRDSELVEAHAVLVQPLRPAVLLEAAGS